MTDTMCGKTKVGRCVKRFALTTFVALGMMLGMMGSAFAAPPAPAPAPSGVGDTTGLQSWLGKSILPVIITLIALTMAVHSRKKKNRDIIEMSLGAIIALTWFAIAIVPDKAASLGTFALGMIGL